MGVVVPSMSRRITRTCGSASRVTQVILPPVELEYIWAPGRRVHNFDLQHYECSGESSRKHPETTGSHEFACRRKDQTSEAYRAARGSSRRLPPQSPRPDSFSDARETVRVPR